MAVQQHVLNWLYSVLTSEYQDVNRTYNDVSQALSQFPSLSPRTDVHTFPNGTSALLLHLSGTLPAVFRGATYRYPISLWVPHAYPREAPLVYVTPTENMMVRPGQHVDPQGQVYHPYLAGWSEFWDKSTIVDFLTILRDVFAKEPPVISRQSSRAPPTAQPPPVTQTPPPVPPLPQELATPSRPPTTTAASAAAQRPAPPPKGSIQELPNTITSQTSTPSPPPIPPYPHNTNNTGSRNYAAAQTRSPPPPPHPQQSSASYRNSWYDSRPSQATDAGPSSRNNDLPARPGAPPIPGRPPYQQSPLSQPPMSSGQQQQVHPPYGQQQQQNSATPPPPLPSGYTANGYGPSGQPPSSYYPYSQQQQQQQQAGYAPQQPPPPSWQLQQQQQQSSQQAYQQYLPQQQQPLLQPVQQRPKLPPPPDIMDEPLTSPPDGNNSSGQSNLTAQPPPPVPPNPEKDALLHQLAKTLAGLRQRSRAQNESSLAGLQAQRAAMLTAAGRLQQEMSDLAQLSALLTSNTAILHETLAEADNVMANSKQTTAPAIDDLLVGPTVVANQLYDLVAEERALADAVFMLGRAVERGRVSPAVFAKMTRSLAREWYLKKALVRKIAHGMGLTSA